MKLKNEFFFQIFNLKYCLLKAVQYEAVEAHCKCIGKANMECIRFESRPLTNYSRCICTYDNEMSIAWPCFNISLVFSVI